MSVNIWHECLGFGMYYAPRGRARLLMLGETIGQRYLSSSDLLIGVLGEAGTGKSTIINGIFPGLELTNDDSGVNIRPVPLLRMHREGRFSGHTFHIDVRFEMAFAQLYEIVEAIRAALADKRRIVVEHFEEVFPALEINAQVLLGVGEDIIVTRPNIFGPFPEDILQAIRGTAIYRKMAHTAEDMTSMVLEEEFGIMPQAAHSDVPRGFVMEFDERPEGLDIQRLQRRVQDIIRSGVEVAYLDSSHIRIGSSPRQCTGPRIHVTNSSEIENFRLMNELVYDELAKKYCLVGLVAGPKSLHIIERHPDRSKPRYVP